MLSEPVACGCKVEFTRLVRCSIATIGNLPITIQPNVLSPFTYVMGRRASISIKNFQYNRHSLVSRVYYRAFYGWAQRKKFQNKGSQIAGNAILITILAITLQIIPLTVRFFT